MLRRSVSLLVLAFALILTGCSDSSSPTGMDPDPGGGGGSGGTGEAFNSQAAPGDSARAFLNGDPYSTLRLEVDYMEGYAPTPEALQSLQSELEQHLDKSSIQIESPTEIPAQGRTSYTIEQIRDLEQQHRDAFTSAGSNTIWAYFLIVDGEFEQQNVVGVAYYNTSMAFFGETIASISGGVTQPSRNKVEATVFRHEFGHNLGLVNNGTEMQQDHQDDPNGAHCTNDACVMYFSIETTDYFGNVFDGTVPEFGSFCTEDMAALANP